MGPLSADPEIRPARRSIPDPRWLQWGRYQLIAEIAPDSSVAVFGDELQWGRYQLIAEIRTFGKPAPYAG